MKINSNFIPGMQGTIHELRAVTSAEADEFLKKVSIVEMEARNHEHYVARCYFTDYHGDGIFVHFRVDPGESAFPKVLVWLTERVSDTTKIDWFGIKLQKEGNNVTVSASQ